MGAAHTEKTDSGGRDALLWPLPSMTVRGARNRIQHDCLVACVSRDFLARLEVPLSAGVVDSKTFPFWKIIEMSRPINDHDVTLHTVVPQLFRPSGGINSREFFQCV